MPTLSMFEGRSFFRIVVVLVLVLLLWNLALIGQQGTKSPTSDIQQCSVDDAAGNRKVDDEMEIPLLSTVPSTSFRRMWSICYYLGAR